MNPRISMMYRYIFNLLVCSFCFSALSIAQPITSYKYDDMLKTADERMEASDYYNALEWYNKAYREVKSEDVALSMAYAYYKMRDFANAEKWYTRVLQNDEDNIFVNDRYAYARVLRSLGENEKAKIEYQKYMASADDEVLKNQAEIELEGIDAITRFEPNRDVNIRFLSDDINSGSGEYSPAQFDDKTLYFASFQARKEIIIDGKEKDYHAKLYRTTKGDKGFEKPEELDKKINREGFHHSNVCFSPDKRQMFFARQLIENDQVTSSTIYMSKMGDEDWETPVALNNINGDWLSMQPAVGEILGRDVLYFVSSMDGGIGGLDIFYAPLTADGVGMPVNLGEEINTPADDITPHYYDGVLYFSTEARVGLGGYDIFKSTWDGTNWSRPENLGHNYNSPFDDYYFSYNDKGTQGYLVSNRPDEKKKKLKSETCCFDIYNFNIKELKIDLLVGVGTEDEKPLNGATVELADLTVYGIPERQTQEEEYRFSFGLDSEKKYQVITSKEGFISDTITLNTIGIIEDQSIRKKVLLKKLPPQDTLPEYVTETVSINEAIRLNNIYYDFDKWDILPASEEDLNVLLNLLNEYDNMVIELSSHTDSRGINPYNERLSQKRAESAATWLIEKGIDPKRIVPKGYGEEKILNGCINGVRCSEEEHRFNRRTEFKILEGPQTIEIRREVKKPYQGGKQSLRRANIDTIPVIQFKKKLIELGEIKQGDQRTIIYEFTNVGDGDLVIELATACKCTEIIWPKEAIKPGEEGKITAVFDSTGMEGEYDKTIDIIANTEPIVVEAKFKVTVVR